MTTTVNRHRRLLLVFTLTIHLLAYFLLCLASLLPLFDSSPLISPISKWSQPLLRWDAFHFAHIAEKGYVYEYEWAFFPGPPLLIRGISQALYYCTGSRDPLGFIIAGTLAVLACDTTSTLYDLTLHHLGSPSLAFMASVLSLVSSSPVSLRFAAYSEPFFTYLTYKGMLCSARSQWFIAALYFALAGVFRANGILSSGFILWGLIIGPFLDGQKLSPKRATYSVLLTSLIFTPFVHHHLSAYLAFCTISDSPPAWCSNFPPSIYAYVQSKYWNVGLLRYWTPQQLPNFIISAPPLASLFTFSLYHLRHGFISRLTHISRTPKHQPALAPRAPSQSTTLRESPFLSPSLTPHAIHALLFGMIILLASHTQIILRFAASMPITYWAASWLVLNHSTQGRWWVGWSVIWGTTSVVLWCAFLPPA